MTDPVEPDPWGSAEELPWLPTPKMRILDRWIDAAGGHIASLDVLIRAADGDRRELLHAVQEETDLLNPGYRIYRDPERRDLSLPPPPRRFRARMGGRRTGYSQK